MRTGEGPGYRPAMAKVRGALFSMLEARGLLEPGCRVLDLFAGSGSLGFEALSRGAGFACFVESSAPAAAIIRKNVELLGLDASRALILGEESGKMLGRGPDLPYDLVFIDPPYNQKLLAPTLSRLMQRGWLAAGGCINADVEARLRFDPATAHPELEVIADRAYGQTRVVLWTRANIK